MSEELYLTPVLTPKTVNSSGKTVSIDNLGSFFRRPLLFISRTVAGNRACKPSLRGVLLNYRSRAVAREFLKTSFSGKPF